MSGPGGFGSLTKNDSDGLLLLELSIEGLEEGKNLWTSHLYNEMIRGTRGSFIVLLKETA